MGGQIMPPVMGAVAFIMAETIDVPYVTIVKAAIIPAILYFVTAFWMVHLEAGHKKLMGLPKEECPDPWVAVRERWYLLIPLAGLVALLFSGYTPLFSGTVGLALTVILIFGAAVASGVRGTPLRVLFWVLLALACGGFVQFGVMTFVVLTVLLVAATFLMRLGRDTRQLAVKALVDGARHALPVAVACALVGVIIGVINLTGVAAEMGGMIIDIGRKSLFLALFLTMLTCLVLGMGIPTIPNYIITSSLAAPVLLELGVPLIVSHMFVFYFGIMADLTPPVALACFAAAPIARETGLKISIQAIRVAIAGFVVPYMAVYAPALMMQSGTWVDTVWVLFKALIAIGMWGAGAIGFLIGPLAWWERIVAVVSASFLVVALPVTDEIGLGLVALFVAWHAWRVRQRQRVR
jgi:TRAP transporter 4TM/12TM fusion protein